MLLRIEEGTSFFKSSIRKISEVPAERRGIFLHDKGKQARRVDEEMRSQEAV